jgi:hypothetical protein
VRLRREKPPEGPSEVYITLADGSRVECLIERTGPTDWQATAVLDVDIEDVTGAFADILPGGHTIAFVIGDVWVHEDGEE